MYTAINLFNKKQSERQFVYNTGVVHVITDLSDGGAQSILYSLCSYESPCSDVIISLRGGGKYGKLLESKGCKVVCLEIGWGLSAIVRIINIVSYLRLINPKVIQGWMYHANLFASALKLILPNTEVIWGIHNTRLIPGKSKTGTILICRILAILSYMVPKKIVCCASAALSHHQKIGYNKNKLAEINNGYNVEKYKNAFFASLARYEEVRLQRDPVFEVVMVARNDPVKGHQILFESIAEITKSIPNIAFNLIGLSGRGNKLFAHQLRDTCFSKCEIKIHGEISDLTMEYCKYDILVLPSLQEAFPNVLCEAMASGIPCIATDVGDCKYIVGDTGWLIPPNDKKALADAVVESFHQWMNDRDLFDRKKRSARKRVSDRFGVQIMVESYRRIWRAKTDQSI